MYVYLYIYVYIYIYIYTYDEVGKNKPLLKKYLNIFAIAFTNCFFFISAFSYRNVHIINIVKREYTFHEFIFRNHILNENEAIFRKSISDERK